MKGSSVTISKKTELPRRPLIFSGADVWATRRKEELAIENKSKLERIKAMEVAPGGSSDTGSDPKGKRKATDDLVPESSGERYSVELVTRASAKRAARITGRTIGIARLEEMIAFERRGMELGELPPDHDLSR